MRYSNRPGYDRAFGTIVSRVADIALLIKEDLQPPSNDLLSRDSVLSAQYLSTISWKNYLVSSFTVLVTMPFPRLLLFMPVIAPGSTAVVNVLCVWVH